MIIFDCQHTYKIHTYIHIELLALGGYAKRKTDNYIHLGKIKNNGNQIFLLNEKVFLKK